MLNEKDRFTKQGRLEWYFFVGFIVLDILSAITI